MSRKSILLLSFVLSVAMIAPAQQGGGGRGGGGDTGGNTGGNTGGRGQGGNQGGGNQQDDPFGQQNDPFGQQRQQDRPIFLSGQVLLDDGNPPSEAMQNVDAGSQGSSDLVPQPVSTGFRPTGLHPKCDFAPFDRNWRQRFASHGSRPSSAEALKMGR